MNIWYTYFCGNLFQMVNVGLFMCIKQLGWKNVFFFQQDCAFWCWSPASPGTDHCRPQACEDCSFGQNAGEKNVWTIFGSGVRKKHARDRGWEFSSSTNIKKQLLKEKNLLSRVDVCVGYFLPPCVGELQLDATGRGAMHWRGCARFKSVVVGLGSL